MRNHEDSQLRIRLSRLRPKDLLSLPHIPCRFCFHPTSICFHLPVRHGQSESKNGVLTWRSHQIPSLGETKCLRLRIWGIFLHRVVAWWLHVIFCNLCCLRICVPPSVNIIYRTGQQFDRRMKPKWRESALDCSVELAFQVLRSLPSLHICILRLHGRRGCHTKSFDRRDQVLTSLRHFPAPSGCASTFEVSALCMEGIAIRSMDETKLI